MCFLLVFLQKEDLLDQQLCPLSYDNSADTVSCTRTQHNLILTHISVLGSAARQCLMPICFALQPRAGTVCVPALTHWQYNTTSRHLKYTAKKNSVEDFYLNEKKLSNVCFWSTLSWWQLRTNVWLHLCHRYRSRWWGHYSGHKISWGRTRQQPQNTTGLICCHPPPPMFCEVEVNQGKSSVSSTQGWNEQTCQSRIFMKQSCICFLKTDF